MQRIKKILMLVFIFIVTLNINYLGMIDKRIIVEVVNIRQEIQVT